MKYQIGDIVEGEVTGIEEYGFFIKVGNDYNGLVHISEIVDGFVNDVNFYVMLNEKIYVHILNIDEPSKQMKLSIKNINYRMNHPDTKVRETLSGFLPLYEKLDYWIEESLQKMMKSEEKNNK